MKATRTLNPVPAATQYLKDQLARSQVFKEIFFTDKNGYNAAISNLTSDYVQSDEEWWVNAWTKGVDIGGTSQNPLLMKKAATPGARVVYDTFEQRVRETAQGPLRFYAEIHGNNRRESAGRIEIATVGVDREYAQRLRALCELIRDAHLRGRAGAPRLEVLVEPADLIFYAATGAKRDGILRMPERAVHVELPKTARVEFRELYTAILADFVAQAVTLPRGR